MLHKIGDTISTNYIKCEELTFFDILGKYVLNMFPSLYVKFRLKVTSIFLLILDVKMNRM